MSDAVRKILWYNKKYEIKMSRRSAMRRKIKEVIIHV